MHEHTQQADVHGDRDRNIERQGKEEIQDLETESVHTDAKSQIYDSFCCFSFVFSSTFPPSSISCGDLSFPAGPMLISYWSSGLRVGVCKMGKRERWEVKGGGIWFQAKNNLHLHFSRLLILKYEQANFFLFFFNSCYNHTHLNTWERPRYNYSLISVQDVLLSGSWHTILLKCIELGESSLFTCHIFTFILKSTWNIYNFFW